MVALLTAAICLHSDPYEDVIRDCVDVIEVNHLLRPEDGSLRQDQVIFWKWDPGECEFALVAWRLLPSEVVRERYEGQQRGPRGMVNRPKWRGGHAVPLYNARTGLWVSAWRDRMSGAFREIAAPAFRETWTVYDPAPAQNVADDRYRLTAARRRFGE